jgi:hypothetical protein
LANAEELSEILLFKSLVDPCRYNRIQRPEAFDEHGNLIPVNVHTRLYVYFLQNLDSAHLQFKMHAMLQLRYFDYRMAFGEIAKRENPIIGEDDLRKQLWVPHLFFANEK